MKAYLFAIPANVITPANLTSSFVKGVKNTGARTDEDRILRDRGDGEDSTTSVVLPNELWCSPFWLLNLFRLSAAQIHEHE